MKNIKHRFSCFFVIGLLFMTIESISASQTCKLLRSSVAIGAAALLNMNAFDQKYQNDQKALHVNQFKEFNKSSLSSVAVSTLPKNAIKLPQLSTITYADAAISMTDEERSLLNGKDAFLDLIDYKVHYPGSIKTKFNDVVGHAQAKEVLQKYIMYYQSLQHSYFDLLTGAKNKVKIAHPGNQLLISGQAGNGKTFLMQALAGELNCPVIAVPYGLFHLKKSDAKIEQFIEKAKRLAPCVIYIDEFDRVVVKDGGDKEDIAHIDNFLTKLHELVVTHPTITILGTVTDFDSLENEISQKYKFSENLQLAIPTSHEMVMFLQKTLQDKQVSDDVKLPVVARMLKSEGRPSYRDIVFLKSVLDQILVQDHLDPFVFQDRKDCVNMQDIENALDILTYGDYSEIHKDHDFERLVAHHEAGHALLSLLSSYCILHRANIINHGDTKGFIQNFPISEEYTETIHDLDHRLAILFAGGVAEQFLEQKIFTSVHDGLDDFFNRTTVASDAAKAYQVAGDRFLLNKDYYLLMQFDEEKIKKKISEIMQNAYLKAIEIIGDNAEQHKAIADLLMKEKKVSGKKIYELCGKEQPKYDFEK